MVIVMLLQNLFHHAQNNKIHDVLILIIKMSEYLSPLLYSFSFLLKGVNITIQMICLTHGTHMQGVQVLYLFVLSKFIIYLSCLSSLTNTGVSIQWWTLNLLHLEKRTEFFIQFHCIYFINYSLLIWSLSCTVLVVDFASVGIKFVLPHPMMVH